MDQARATDLLENLLERAAGAAERVFLTTRELEAVAFLLGRDFRSADPAVVPEPPARLLPLEVDPDQIEKGGILCLDFGTSFSKAFVSIEGQRLRLVDLALGEDGSLVTPSELFIEGDIIHFGEAAHRRWMDVEAPSDALIDAIKQFITLDEDVSRLGERRMTPAQDTKQRFFKRDILVLYLAHLTALAEKAMTGQGLTVNVKRRFTHPAWVQGRHERNEKEMRRLMAEAVILARAAPEAFLTGMSVAEARGLLDELAKLSGAALPFVLIDEAVREATAAGCGALTSTGFGNRDRYLVLDIGAGTTDIAGFICVNSENEDRARVYEVTHAANAKNMAGNRLDQALERLVIDKSGLSLDSAEAGQAIYMLRRNRRIYKEQLFNTGTVLVELPTNEIVEVTLEEFRAFAPIKQFEAQISEMIEKSAVILAGDADVLKLVATGGGARLPMIAELAEAGVTFGDRFIRLVLVEAMSEELKSSHPHLVGQYPQVAVAVGGALPDLPEQRESVGTGIRFNTPKHVATSTYR